VDYHSGEPFDGTDWTPTVTTSSVSWTTSAYAVNPNANALRWGTLYNFRFDANVAPGTSPVVIGLFRPGSPATVSPSTLTPGPCGGAPNGTACDDLNACTQTDSCLSGACAGSSPVTCAPLDTCHVAGTCNPTTGACSNPARPDGTACSDANACTTTDACQSGVCTGSNPVTCSAIDACHDAGSCEPTTGLCSSPAKPNGSPCDDANACTANDACQDGVCAGNGTALPGEVGSDVQVSHGGGITTISWSAAAGSSWSNVLRGLVSQLPVGPGGGDEVCLAPSFSGTTATDVDDPGLDAAFWYLIQGGSACGNGTYGFGGQNGVPSDPRQSTTCP